MHIKVWQCCKHFVPGWSSAAKYQSQGKSVANTLWGDVPVLHTAECQFIHHLVVCFIVSRYSVSLMCTRDSSFNHIHVCHVSSNQICPNSHQDRSNIAPGRHHSPARKYGIFCLSLFDFLWLISDLQWLMRLRSICCNILNENTATKLPLANICSSDFIDRKSVV